MGGLVFDNVCVLVGVIVLWLAKGCSYSLEGLLQKKTREGVSRRSNWLEAIVGFVVILVVVALIKLL